MSRLPDLLNMIESIWEALTPPDRAAVRYHRVDGPGELRGGSGDRCFWFETAGGQAQSESGSAYTEYEHRVIAKLQLEAGGYNRRDLEARIANEAIQLMRAIDIQPEPWGGDASLGIINVVSQSYAVTARRDDAVTLSLTITAFIQEA